MRKGFTLLELLIVVIVIGILAGVAIPQYLKVVERGKAAKAKNNLGIIAQAQKMYRTENDAYVDGNDFTELDDWTEGLSDALKFDDDWEYDSDGDTEEFTVTATRTGKSGDYGQKEIQIDQDNIICGDHPFSGQDCSDIN